ncbi:MAG: hypothetical protein JJE45_07965 [Prolixibacteraceae bacterium]|nr:hypothetical protein [Prolixibacteraceae bacterium]
MKHAQYYRNIANGIARINQCVQVCKFGAVKTGTIFSERFKKNIPGAVMVDISHLDEDSIQALKDIEIESQKMLSMPNYEDDDFINHFMKGLSNLN